MTPLDPDFGIVGYTDRWSYRPGESVQLHLSARAAGPATARLYRVRAGSAAEDGPGISFEATAAVEQALQVGPQRTVLGSWLEIDGVRGLPLASGFTLAVQALPTHVGDKPHGLFDLIAAETGLAVTISESGTLEAVAVVDGKRSALRLGAALRIGRWSRIGFSYDPERGKATLFCENADGSIRMAQSEWTLPLDLSGAPLRFAAAPTELLVGARCFNGRMESPVLLRGACSAQETFAALAAIGRGECPDESVLAGWDFSLSMTTDTAPDLGTRWLHGRFHNLPTRAVRGVHWDGGEQSWRHAPRQYAAVHFHEDDLWNSAWDKTGEIRLPDELPSGIYVIAVEGPQGRDALPIFVGPPRVRAAKASARPKLALVLPTFTYLAYVNDRCLLHGANPEVLAHRLLVLTKGDCFLAAHPEFGLSLYDTHADGSGVSFASRRRPCLTLRHTQRAWQGGLGPGLWNFPADLSIAGWLERNGLEFDVLTDDILEEEGALALSAYACVLTGTHPEYHTQKTLDAFAGFLAEGGRLVSMGGNGFYWRVATSPAFPETIELRRAEDGNRSWAAEPGEYYHAFDGTYGGLWRRNGRAPQALVGAGYVGQGFVRSRPYRRLPASNDPRAAFLFEGIGEGPLGDFGLCGGGAAGIEIDCANAALGTPAHALVLATADDFDDTCILANEEVLVNRPTLFGDLAPQLRADLVFFETPAGGAVLATGSIAWAGSMAHPREPNPVSQLTLNAVRRFLDPSPFSLPR